jgi:plastocyanin
MFRQSRRTFALALLIGSAGILFPACGGVDKGGADGSGTAAINATPASNNATASTASNAASENAPGGSESAQIEMDDDVFKPTQLTVPAGTKVTWVNKGKKAHTVVSKDKLFDSGLVQVGGQFSYKFDTPGTYFIRCSPHPKMLGQIVVQ